MGQQTTLVHSLSKTCLNNIKGANIRNCLAGNFFAGPGKKSVPSIRPAKNYCPAHFWVLLRVATQWILKITAKNSSKTVALCLEMHFNALKNMYIWDKVIQICPTILIVNGNPRPPRLLWCAGCQICKVKLIQDIVTTLSAVAFFGMIIVYVVLWVVGMTLSTIRHGMFSTPTKRVSLLLCYILH